MAYLHGKFMWFQHFSDDVPKARAFYAALFGWKTDPVPMGAEPYPLIQNAGQGIGGFRAAPPGGPNHWMSYLSVPDVDAATNAAQAAGAKVLMPPTDFAPVGRGAALADPTGAVFSVWKGTGDDPPDTEPVPPGAWYWNECWTPRRDAALAFYETVFGFGHETMTSRTGPYHILMKGGIARGGIMQADTDGPPATWMPYVSVADCDGTAKRAEQLGAHVGLPPTDIPDVGRITLIRDTCGALIGAIKGKFTG
jgi:predicted enzyme related to lactoylglutathione lyase